MVFPASLPLLQGGTVMIVYVATQGARVVREGRHLLVKKENDTYHTEFFGLYILFVWSSTFDQLMNFCQLPHALTGELTV